MIPTCPKCQGTSFSLEELKVQKSNFQLFGVCCMHCGAVVDIQEDYNISSLVYKLAGELNVKLD